MSNEQAQEVESTPEPEVGKEPSPEELKQMNNMRLLHSYQTNIALVEKLTLHMTTRQLGRVLRSLMKAPLQDHDKFQDQREKLLFDIGMQIMDAKMLLVMEQQGDIEKELKATRESAVELEEKGEKQDG